MNHPVRNLRCRLSVVWAWRARHVILTTIATIVAIVVGIGTIFNFWIVRDPGQPIGAVEGKVRKAGRQPWHDVEGAWPGALLEYRVTTRNAGGANLDHLVVTVSVPTGIRILPETCRYISDSGESKCPANWMANGISCQSLTAFSSFTFVLQAQLKRDVGDSFQTLKVEANSDETSPVSDEVEVKPRATHAQAAARSLIGSASEAPINWHGRPEAAVRSEKLLIDHWPELNPEQLHSFDSIRSDQQVSVERLAHDRRLDGRVVTFVATVHDEPNTYAGYRPHWDGGTEAQGPRLTKQTFIVRDESSTAEASCVTTREAGRRLHGGDLVRIRAVPIAWGSADTDGGMIAAVALDCAATHRVPAVDREATKASPLPGTLGRCE